MILDFAETPDKEINTELCLVGAGAAGLAIARALSATGLEICVLESGGLEYEQPTQNLYQGVDEGLPVLPGISRLRYFGGTTNHWEGQCVPLSPIDFEHRDWVPESGWPLSYDDLLPHYFRAQEFCGLGKFRYDAELWLDAFDGDPQLSGEVFSPYLWQFSPGSTLRFGQSLREEAMSWENVDIWLHANVTQIVTNKDETRVDELVVASLNGDQASVRAKRFVLCGGAIANSRMLLYSNGINPKGVGNTSDNVGRYFMQHPHADIAEILPKGDAEKEVLKKLIGARTLSEQNFNGVAAQAGMRLTEKEQRRTKLLNHGFYCHTGAPLNTPASDFVDIAKRLKRGQIPDNMGSKLENIVSNGGEVWDFIKRAMSKGANEALEETTGNDAILVQMRMEQTPNAESRLLLNNSKDSLGLPMLTTRWKLNELDRSSILQTAEKLGAELGKMDLGRMRLAEWFANFDPKDDSNENWHPGMWGGFHHMGGTRMSRDPQKGVVDHNCRVHGVDNLFIAGSSVFCTSGCANPTLTLLALSFRLADHLNNRTT